MRRSQLIIFPALIVSLLFAASCARHPSSGTPADFAELKRSIRERFPEVPQISTEELSNWFATPPPGGFLLLDARAPEEFAVSHLAGAQLAASEVQALSDLKDTARDHPVVVYCSVGYRSSALAQRLTAHGYQEVYNLEGSIFEWANEGRPVFRGDRQVKMVHPYDSK